MFFRAYLGWALNLFFSQILQYIFISFKLSCDSRFQIAFAACGCVFKVITLG